MTESRVAELLRAYGVSTRMSIRSAAGKTGLSRETLSRLMRPLENGETRRIRKDNLDKIADGLDIPRDLLERENMADWGYTQAVSGSDVADVLARIRNLSPAELADVQVQVARMQQAQLRARDDAPNGPRTTPNTE